MPIIVNKEEKVKDICARAYQEFISEGIEDISLNKLISNIGISKGQFYHYFKTKEELIFEVMSYKTLECMELANDYLKTADSLNASLKILFSLYIDENEYFENLRNVLFDTLSIYIHSDDKKVKNYNEEYYKWIDEKLIEIFEQQATKNYSRVFIKSVLATADGMYLRSLCDDTFDLKINLTNYLDEVSK